MFGNELNKRMSKKDKSRSLDPELENYLNQRNATLGEDAKSLFKKEEEEEEMSNYVKHPASPPHLPKVGVITEAKETEEKRVKDYLKEKEKDIE